MKAVVLGAGRAVRVGAGPSVPKCLLEGLAGWRVLDWLLNALREGGGVDDFVFVAGDAMDSVQRAYPELRYVYNPRWSEEHVVGSLFCAASELEGAFYFSYADVVYRPRTVARLHEATGDVVIVVDRSWRTRYADRTRTQIAQAEKVVVRDGTVRWIGKELPDEEFITGEFIGLARFSERGSAWLRRTYAVLAPTYANHRYREHRDLHAADLTDLLQEMIEQGFTIDAVEIDGDFAELDTARDLQNFVFGTKAETLERLRPMIKQARIAEGVHVQVGEWLENPRALAAEFAHRFGGEALAIRSSALAEDQANASGAGRYHSVLGVPGSDIDAIATAVDEVVASYEKDGCRHGDQVLVQPCLTDVAMSGVMMTRDVDTGAEYFVVHYDAESGRTDRVTAGSAGATETVKILRGAQQDSQDPRLCALLDAATELESITGSDALDIEFAFDRDETLHVLQVRPIARHAAWTPVDPRAHAEEMASLRDFLAGRLGAVAGLGGTSTVLGQMPDWNPAEMIGPFPHVLARTLYEHLITDCTWREARVGLGYADAYPHALMVELAGRTFIDVRLSANSLLPAALDPELRARVVDAGLRRLRAEPQLHDKIEFEIFPTAWHLHLGPVYEGLVRHGLPREDLAALDAALLTHTTALVDDGELRIAELLRRTEPLEQHTNSLVEDESDLLDRLRTLLGWTIREGTLPFAALARLAFVGTSLLRSLRDTGLLSAEQLTAFTAGVRTISSDMVEALDAVRRGENTLERFLERFGHLRPGTYDLLSPRYDQDPHLYFGDLDPGPCGRTDEPDANPWDDVTHARIDAALAASGSGLDTDRLVGFVRAAIAARELAKFRFTYALSAALELLVDFGARHDLTREDLVHLDVKSLLECTRGPRSPQLADELRRIISRTRQRREQLAKILLPGLLTSIDDLEWVHAPASRPNFVSRGRVHAELARLDAPRSEGGAALELEGKVVLLEGADPGYDWIFTHGIAGLITCYGGANSHMTIRCAEFSLPAAIGCGDSLYEQLTHARSVELDCGGETIRVLH